MADDRVPQLPSLPESADRAPPVITRSLERVDGVHVRVCLVGGDLAGLAPGFGDDVGERRHPGRGTEAGVWVGSHAVWAAAGAARARVATEAARAARRTRICGTPFGEERWSPGHIPGSTPRSNSCKVRESRISAPGASAGVLAVRPARRRRSRRRRPCAMMPMIRPCMSTSGPPELPGLMAASVWMALRMRDPSGAVDAPARGGDDAAGDAAGEPVGVADGDGRVARAHAAGVGEGQRPQHPSAPPAGLAERRGPSRRRCEATRARTRRPSSRTVTSSGAGDHVLVGDDASTIDGEAGAGGHAVVLAGGPSGQLNAGLAALDHEHRAAARRGRSLRRWSRRSRPAGAAPRRRRG